MTHQNNNNKLRLALWALVLPPLFWSGNTVLGKFTVIHVPPLLLNTLRWGLAAVLFAPFSWAYVKRDWDILFKHRWHMLGFALTGAVGYNSFLYLGLRSTSIVNASLILATTPAVFGALTALLLRERITAWQWFGALISMLGVLQIALRGDWLALASLNVHLGDVYVFAGVLSYSLYTVFLRFVPRVHPFAFMQVFFTLGCLGTLLWLTMNVAFGGSVSIDVPWSAVAWQIGYMAIFASIAATFFWNFGVKYVGAIRAGYYINLIPVFTIIWAVFLVGETVKFYQMVGMLVVCFGLLLALIKK
ncbi:DMT family transporter [Hydromonas duriensis]|nr:DMT family transporter [Hydromonas duriensis]